MITKLSVLTLDVKKDPYAYLLALDKDIKSIFNALGQGVTQTGVVLSTKTVQISNGLIVSPSGII